MGLGAGSHKWCEGLHRLKWGWEQRVINGGRDYIG